MRRSPLSGDGARFTAGPTVQAHDQDRTRRAREQLLTDGLLASPVARFGVRTVIERSWRRCLDGSVPTGPTDVPYRDTADLRPGLRDAASPVLARLGDQLSDVRVAMFVSDERGQSIMRTAAEPRHRSQLDNACAAEGFDFSEGSIGANGLGTVIEERRPLLVRGSEHFNDVLASFTCAGTPIFEPFTRKVVGTFALACATTEASPLMSAMAADVGRQIEGNLTAGLGARERALIGSYLLAERGDRDPVIVVNERTAFANTAGLSHLSLESHALLWTHLGDAGPRAGQVHMRVPLPSGWHDAVVEHVDAGGRTHTAWCVRLVDPPARRGGRGSARPSPAEGPPRPSFHPVPDVDAELADAVRLQECLAVDGGPGTGKLHVTSAVLSHLTGCAPMVIDLSACPPADRPAWPSHAAEALRAGRGVVLRHLQDLAAADVNRVKSLTAYEGPARPPLAITVDLNGAADHVHTLVGQIATVVHLPALRDVREHVTGLVAEFVGALPAPESRTTFSSDALQLLMLWSWPGNIAELRHTVEAAARRMPARTLGVPDLPSRMQHDGHHRNLSMLEHSERETIVTALRRCDGNRTRAAEVLGIGRTTLYRKLRAHHIDG